MIKVLELGCGNSQLYKELYKDGITKITCIDLSYVVVEMMKERLLSKGYKGVFGRYFSNVSIAFSFLCT